MSQRRSKNDADYSWKFDVDKNHSYTSKSFKQIKNFVSLCGLHKLGSSVFHNFLLKNEELDVLAFAETFAPIVIKQKRRGVVSNAY